MDWSLLTISRTKPSSMSWSLRAVSSTTVRPRSEMEVKPSFWAVSMSSSSAVRSTSPSGRASFSTPVSSSSFLAAAPSSSERAWRTSPSRLPSFLPSSFSWGLKV